MDRIPYNPQLKQRAQFLRKNATSAEIILWRYLKNKQLGVDFNRQKPLGNYIVDFYCIPLKLAIEIDGKSHELKETYDFQRNRQLQIYGRKILRFTNEQVKYNVASVIKHIKNNIQELLVTPRLA